MALTLPRWIALALAGFAFVPVLLMGGDEPEEWSASPRDHLTRRVARASIAARTTAEQAHVARLRDSIARAVRRAPAAVTLYDAALDPVTRQVAETLATRAGAFRSAAARVPVSIAFILDVPDVEEGVRRGFFGAMAMHYLLPDTSTAGRCVVMTRVRRVGDDAPRSFRAELTSENGVDRLMGPCAFLEQFGLPGQEVDAWLRRRGWSFARKGTWRAPGEWRPADERTDSRQVDLHQVMRPEGVSCVAGNDEACLAGLLEPADRRGVPGSGAMISTAHYNPFRHADAAWFTSRLPFGAREWTLLAGMVRSLGPERFQEFWQSGLPVPEAFERAAGQPLAVWTREWLRETYHPQRTGPSVSVASIGMGTVLAALAIVFALGAANRRQVA